MKRKFSLMWRVAITLVMVVTLGLVTVTPAAANVSSATVTVDPAIVSLAAKYTITFTTYEGLAMSVGDDIRVEFPSDTTVPVAATIQGNVTVKGNTVTAATVVGRLVTLKVPADVPAGSVTVVFALAATIQNPSTAGSYNLKVSTSDEVTLVTSSPYTITLPPPTITKVAPPKANQGETLDVFITGTNFTGDATVSFGAGITVNSFTVVDAQNITASITIAVSATIGTRDVTVTTLSGTDTKTASFEVLAAGTALVDRYNSSGVYQGNYPTITAAIADTSTIAGDILIAHAANYGSTVEPGFPITVNKALTLRSYMGAASTKITVAAPNPTIRVTATDVTIGGSGSGFTLTGQTGHSIPYGAVGIHVNPGKGDGLTIKGNIIRGVSAGDGVGIALEGAVHDGVLIDSNSFYGDAAWTTNSVAGGPGTAILVTGTSGGGTALTISNNVAYYLKYTFLTFVDGPLNGVVVVTGNEAHDNRHHGIQIGSGVSAIASNGLKIYKNKFYNNGNGIEIRSNTVNVGNIQIWYNDIYANTNTAGGQANKGVNNESAVNATAKYNWWGGIGGPGGVGLGGSDNVSTMVLYDPWLTRTQATAVGDGIAYHGSTYELQAGWNTLSVPLALDDNADTMNDIVALGDFIVLSGVNQNYLLGYYYTGGVWLPLPGTHELKPGEAVYVKMKAEADFPVLFSGVFSVPSVSLAAGWNLVGSMFGIDKTGDNDGQDYGIAATGDTQDGQKAVNVALASLGANASVVISPSMPGQTAAWATTIGGTSKNMIVGEGYWVFMTAPATLAGFEVTPIYWINLP